MKAIKLIIMFIVVLGGVLGAIFLVTSGGDVPAPSPDTNVLPDTTTTEDTANSSAPLPGAQDEDKVDPNRETEQAEETKMETEKAEKPKEKMEKMKSKKESPKHKYTCDMCGSDTWFYTEKELKNHKNSIHTQSAGTTTRFVCSVCNKNYKTKKQLVLHMNSHNER